MPASAPEYPIVTRPYSVFASVLVEYPMNNPFDGTAQCHDDQELDEQHRSALGYAATTSRSTYGRIPPNR